MFVCIPLVCDCVCVAYVRVSMCVCVPVCVPVCVAHLIHLVGVHHFSMGMRSAHCYSVTCSYQVRHTYQYYTYTIHVQQPVKHLWRCLLCFVTILIGNAWLELVAT